MSRDTKQQLGQWGEEIACKYLENKGYKILDRNFRQKWGEIDIICSIQTSVPRGTLSAERSDNVPRGTLRRKKSFFTWIKGLFKQKEENLWENREKTQRRPLEASIESSRTSKLSFESEPEGSSLRVEDGESKIVFVEVKTLQAKSLRPEESVTFAKQKRLIRSCQVYLSHNNYNFDTDWQIDVIGILLDKKRNKAQVKHIKQAVYFT